MKDKLEVGMYVKFKTLSNQVKLGQIQLIDNSIYELDNNEVTADKYIVKASHNIIDLIEKGDYVNGKKVIDTFIDYIFDYSEEFKVIRFSETDILHDVKHIKSIVTKEQMEQIAYKVEE